MISVTDLKNGTVFKDAQGMWEVVDYKHIKMGRGGATIRVKSRNLISSATIEKTFSSGQKVDDLSVARKKSQFLYADAGHLVFMDAVTFEQYSLPRVIAAAKESFLREGQEYELMIAEDKVLGIVIPNHVVLAISETAPGVRGDTVSNVFKDAVLENSLKVKVPLFINEGDKVKIDTRTNEYVERVK